MAAITTYPLVRHLRGSATSHVQHLVNGRVKHAGTGAGFWFRPLTAVLSEVPVDDRELSTVLTGRTADLQQVSATATLTFRFIEPDLAARTLDFGIDPRTGQWLATPLEQIASVLSETAAGHATRVLARLTLAEVLAHGMDEVAGAVLAGLGASDQLRSTGVTVLGCRISLFRPSPDVEKALATPARELLQQEADRATFERRALAVEREAAIGENELANQIELARREEHLVAQRGANARRAAEEEAASARIATAAEADRVERLAAANAASTRLVGQAEADSEQARLDAYRDLPEQILTGLALRELATALGNVDQLVLTPDLLSPLLARLSTMGSR